jgi:DNA-directed RNA polymerase specialized sigma24 family protein
MPAMSLVAAQEKFTATLKAVEDAARYAFRRRRRQDREEAVAEATAAAWSAWHGLIGKGKDPVGVGVTGIANNAVRYVRNGRRIGNRTCGGRGDMDIWHPRVRRALGLRVASFEELAGPSAGSWRDWLVCDHRVGPAAEAAFRVDFADWLAGLPEKKRRVAVLLAEGHGPGVVARLVDVSPARVSQLRTELAESWEASQGPAPVPGAGDPRRARV